MPTDEELKVLNAVYDEPSRYDYLWRDYVEGIGDGKFCDGFNLKIWNQYDNTDTWKGCSAYGLTYIFNGNQLVEYSKNGIEFEDDDPRWKWLAFQAERGYPNSGASLQEMMYFFNKRGLIDGYTKTLTIEETKNALKNGCGIYTGSSKCSWSATSKTKSFVVGNGGNHCFAIVDYYDGGFRAINSFGESWGDGGYFDIPDDCYQHLFSTYAIIDHDDTGKLGELKYNMEYQKSIEMGITNGTRPNDKATRKETSVMVYRMGKKLIEMIGSIGDKN